MTSMEIGDIAAELGLPVDRVWGWGLSTSSGSAISKPTSVDEVARILTWASEHGVPVAFRGSGCSYGDASQNEGGIVLDATAFARIKSFDIDSGLLVAEPGVTLEQIWRRSVPMGWWPPVVSGTMYPTLGGLLSMNVHGKNNWQVGTIGSWVRSFRLLTVTSGELLCSPEENADLFYAAIGGFGMLGCFTEVTLQLKKIYSGCLDVEAIATPDLVLRHREGQLGLPGRLGRLLPARKAPRARPGPRRALPGRRRRREPARVHERRCAGLADAPLGCRPQGGHVALPQAIHEQLWHARHQRGQVSQRRLLSDTRASAPAIARRFRILARLRSGLEEGLWQGWTDPVSDLRAA
jgi:hypothetical protein